MRYPPPEHETSAYPSVYELGGGMGMGSFPAQITTGAPYGCWPAYPPSTTISTSSTVANTSADSASTIPSTPDAPTPAPFTMAARGSPRTAHLSNQGSSHGHGQEAEPGAEGKEGAETGPEPASPRSSRANDTSPPKSPRQARVRSSGKPNSNSNSSVSVAPLDHSPPPSSSR